MNDVIPFLLVMGLGGGAAGCQSHAFLVSAEGPEWQPGTQIIAPGFSSGAQFVQNAPWFRDGRLTESSVTLVDSRGVVSKFSRVTGRLTASSESDCATGRTQWEELSLSPDGTALMLMSETGVCVQMLDSSLSKDNGNVFSGDAWKVEVDSKSGARFVALPKGLGLISARYDGGSTYLEILPWGEAQGSGQRVISALSGWRLVGDPVPNSDGSLIALSLASGKGAETSCAVMVFPASPGVGLVEEEPVLEVEMDCASVAWVDHLTLVAIRDNDMFGVSLGDSSVSHRFSAPLVSSFEGVAYSNLHDLYAVAQDTDVMLIDEGLAKQSMPLCPGGLVRRLQFDAAGALLVVCSKFSRMLD